MLQLIWNTQLNFYYRLWHPIYFICAYESINIYNLGNSSTDALFLLYCFSLLCWKLKKELYNLKIIFSKCKDRQSCLLSEVLKINGRSQISFSELLSLQNTGIMLINSKQNIFSDLNQNVKLLCQNINLDNNILTVK